VELDNVALDSLREVQILIELVMANAFVYHARRIKADSMCFKKQIEFRLAVFVILAIGICEDL